MKIKISGILFFFISTFLLFLFPNSSNAAKVVGRALAVKGDVKVTRVEKPGEKSKVRVRSRLYEKDVIETGANSKIKILFNDESVMNISENARVEVVLQEKDESTKTNKSVYRLVKGKLRVLVGKISGEKSEYEVKTPTALAAVRGTQFFVWVESEEKTKVFVIDGEVEVENVDIPGVKVAVSEDLWTLVETGIPPVEPSPINMEDMNQLFQDTNIRGDKTVNPKMRRSFRSTGGGEGTSETGGGEGTGEGGGTEGTGTTGGGEGSGGTTGTGGTEGATGGGTEGTGEVGGGSGGTEGTGEVGGGTGGTEGTGEFAGGGTEGTGEVGGGSGGTEGTGEFAGGGTEGTGEIGGGTEGTGETGGGGDGFTGGGDGSGDIGGGDDMNKPPTQTPGEGSSGGKSPGQPGGVVEEKPKPKGKIIIKF